MESKAEQVVESFVRGDRRHTRSPLLTIDGDRLMQLERAKMKRKMQARKVVALDLYGTVIYPSTDVGAQVTNMLRRAGGTQVTTGAFNIAIHTLNSYLGCFGTARDFIGKPNPQDMLATFRLLMEENQIAHPFGETIDDLLNFINRQFCKSVYAAAMTGVPKSLGAVAVWNADYAADPELLALSRWTFFKDETDAMLLRLGDRSNRMTLVTLRQ